MMHGTRKPDPTGRPSPGGPAGEGAVTNSSGVPGGGVSGTTWSNSPSFSSQFTMKAVLAQTSGFEAMASIFDAIRAAPPAGIEAGCSLPELLVLSQRTVGSWSFWASYSNWPTGVRAVPFWYSGDVWAAGLYCSMLPSTL